MTPNTNDKLNDQLSALEKALHQSARRLRTGTTLTVSVGVLLIVLLSGYFAYGYREFATLMEPTSLVGLAEVWLEDQLPAGRKAVQDEIEKASPAWAASLSKQAQNELPTVRTRLERYILEQIDAQVDEALEVTELQFREFLRKHHDQLEQSYKELATNPKLADESFALIAQAVEDDFKFSMQEGAQDMFAILDHMSTKLARLKAAQRLTSDEQLERQALMLARRLQLENVPTTLD